MTWAPTCASPSHHILQVIDGSFQLILPNDPACRIKEGVKEQFHWIQLWPLNPDPKCRTLSLTPPKRVEVWPLWLLVHYQTQPIHQPTSLLLWSLFECLSIGWHLIWTWLSQQSKQSLAWFLRVFWRSSMLEFFWQFFMVWLLISPFLPGQGGGHLSDMTLSQKAFCGDASTVFLTICGHWCTNSWKCNNILFVPAKSEKAKAYLLANFHFCHLQAIWLHHDHLRVSSCCSRPCIDRGTSPIWLWIAAIWVEPWKQNNISLASLEKIWMGMIIMLLFVVALISTDLLVQDLILLQPDDLICCSQACCASGKIFEDVFKEEDVAVLTKVKAHIDFFFVLFQECRIDLGLENALDALCFGLRCFQGQWFVPQCNTFANGWLEFAVVKR